MDYLRRVRNVTCVLFAVAVIAAWPDILQAYPEGNYCTTQPVPIQGMWFHDHEWTSEQCADAEEVCDDLCRECWGSNWECASVQTCYEGDGVFGYCMFN